MQKIFENIMQNESAGAITLMIIVSITLVFILEKISSIKKRNAFLEQELDMYKRFYANEHRINFKIKYDHNILLENLSQLPEFKKIPIERLEEFINKKVEYSRIKEEINY